MGILKGNELCEEFRGLSLLSEAPMEPAILYVDGLILLFCGNVVKPNDDKMYALNRAIMIIEKKLIRLYHELQKKFKLQKIFIVFDGSAPEEKQKTQLKRRQNGVHTAYTIDELKMEFKRHFMYMKIKGIPIEVGDAKGEAELCMYLYRDRNFNSIIYTKDTDFFMIGYSHEPNCPTDCVYMCNEINSTPHESKRTNKLEIYDMAKFMYCNLSREWFQLLMALSGTDYTRTIFTTAMTKALLEKIKQSKIDGVDFFGVLKIPAKIDPNNVDQDLLGYLNKLKLLTKYKESPNRIIAKDDITRLLWYLKYLNNII